LTEDEDARHQPSRRRLYVRITTMMSELDRHRSVACASPDLAVDREEARRHVGLMSGYAGHLSDRCGEMSRVLDGTTSEWGTMMDGCQAEPDWMHGGGMMGEGGMMPRRALAGRRSNA
jgi:hypothetical protein